MNLEAALKVVPDFPKPGIEFLDISPVLEAPEKFKYLTDKLQELCQTMEFSKIVAIESRGFILGSVLAQRMNKGFVMVRKPGKLPGSTKSYSYDLEYGSDTLEILTTSLSEGEKVLILDDVLATGGSASAAYELVTSTGAEVVGFTFFVELCFLKGRDKLKAPVHSVVMR